MNKDTEKIKTRYNRISSINDVIHITAVDFSNKMLLKAAKKHCIKDCDNQ